MPDQTAPYFDPNDPVSYRTLYVHYYKKLYNYGRKFTTDHVLIEDSIQDIFLDYWNKQDRIDQPAALNSFLFTAFRYSLFRKMQRAQRQLPLTDQADEPAFYASAFFTRDNTPEELAEKIRLAMESLTPRQREALFLRFYEALSYEEIADIMHITVKASYKLMARSLLQLKQALTSAAWWWLVTALVEARKNS
ncbi:RNA polymerase sigma factor [Paraflavitalea pollutisoli]|uniref:RNA polymerase sigma factor n=1 Tax=Paraflavitalea pollutisoli TaxID=3034143 RepID=UPI0023EC39F2|nr:sigma-70 family RNA polymerase sigma factor [Paraflavitalea sp. H1-2-19X]